MPVETSGPPALADRAAELKEQRARAERDKLAKAACISLAHAGPILKQAASDPYAVADGRLGVGAFQGSFRLSKAALLCRW